MRRNPSPSNPPAFKIQWFDIGLEEKGEKVRGSLVGRKVE
jgi:hypothetical protein